MRRVGNDKASDYGGGLGGAQKNLEALVGELIKEEGITESGSK